MKIEPTWTIADLVVAIHKRQISEHGGRDGIRDEGLLLSALAEPQTLLAYGENVNVAALAAQYAYSLAKNHPFIDGNKGTALVVMRTFLAMNDLDFVATVEEKYTTFLNLAEGNLTEEHLAQWIETNISR